MRSVSSSVRHSTLSTSLCKFTLWTTSWVVNFQLMEVMYWASLRWNLKRELILCQGSSLRSLNAPSISTVLLGVFRSLTVGLNLNFWIKTIFNPLLVEGFTLFDWLKWSKLIRMNERILKSLLNSWTFDPKTFPPKKKIWFLKNRYF